MKREHYFVGQSTEFWAAVRLVSEVLGYTTNTTHEVKTPPASAIVRAFNQLGLRLKGQDFSQSLAAYFVYRADLVLKQI